jgi:uncharacterized repeat protein (TIGR01451 family)
VTLTATATRGGMQSCELSAIVGGNSAEATSRAAVQVLESSLQLRRLGPTRCFLKSEITFELEANNVGSAPAANVSVCEMLPDGFEFLYCSENGAYDPSARRITWQLATLPQNARRTMNYRVRTTAVGEQIDRAAIRNERGQETTADNSFVVEGIPAMSVEVVDLEDPIEVGGELTYEVRIVNQGSCACTNVRIVGTVPDGLHARDGGGPTRHRIDGSQIAFDPLPKLATKADAVYRIKVRGTQPGDYRFRIQMTSDELKQPVIKEEASRVY